VGAVGQSGVALRRGARGQGGVQSVLEGRARLLAANVNEGVWLVRAGTELRLTAGGWRSIVYVWIWIAEMPRLGRKWRHAGGAHRRAPLRRARDLPC
jgi:hypothetical protein